jgi:Xaa-Pro aminopeptidase
MSGVPPKNELKDRLDRFRCGLERRDLSAALILNEQNTRYLSGFTGNDSALLVTAKRKFLLTDFRYVEEAQHTAAGWTVALKPQGLIEKAGMLAKKLGLRKIGIEPGATRLTDMRAMRKEFKGVKIRPEDGMVGELRLIKSQWEVAQIEKALRIQEKCFKELCAELKPGITERQAAARLRYLMVTQGADDQAFDSMFQINSNSSLPHGRPTDRALPDSAIILMDWGAKLGGYHSDLTRTFFIGRIAPRLRKIHGIVMEAQARAVERIGPGVPLAEVDKAAREHITKAGYGKAFGHSTGHGLGLDIHEAPSLSSRATSELRPGMVVTVEPGIYIPGLGGVRIEDDVLVTPNGHRVLSNLEKGLRWSGQND